MNCPYGRGRNPGARPPHAAHRIGALVGRITDLADGLIGHFVERARSSGATCEEIGEFMGVSKQAAQKRFTQTGPPRRGGFFLNRLAEDARLAVRMAVRNAREMESSQLSTGHLVLGLLDDPESLACRAITGLGGSADDIRSVVRLSPKRVKVIPWVAAIFRSRLTPRRRWNWR